MRSIHTYPLYLHPASCHSLPRSLSLSIFLLHLVCVDEWQRIAGYKPLRRRCHQRNMNEWFPCRVCKYLLDVYAFFFCSHFSRFLFIIFLMWNMKLVSAKYHMKLYHMSIHLFRWYTTYIKEDKRRKLQFRISIHLPPFCSRSLCYPATKWFTRELYTCDHTPTSNKQTINRLLNLFPGFLHL